jgi:gliding motility-associated-like protein
VVNVATSGGSFNFSNLSAGDHRFTVVDDSGCTTNPEVTITQPDELIPSFISKRDALCNGASDGSITIQVTGGTSPYIFTVNGNPASATQNGNQYTFENLSADNYTITVTDQNNCASNPIQIQQEITEPDLLTISLTDFQNISCFNANDGFITVEASGGTPNYIFTLTGPTTPSPVDNGNGTFTFSNLFAGTYTVTVTDPNNCTSTPTQIEQILSQPVQIDVIATPQDISCFGLIDGSIIVENYNAVYTYILTNTAFPSTPINGSVQGTDFAYNNLQAGNYKLEASVAGNNGALCRLDTFLTINEPTLITLTSSQVSTFNAGTGPEINISCNGASDGEISITPTGGTGNYSYAWSTIDGSIPNSTETNKDLTGLTAGTYSVEVKDQNNCPQSFEFILVEPRVLSNTAVVIQNNTCFSGLTGSITSQILNNGSVDGITYTYTIIGAPALPGSYPSTQTTTALSATFNSLPAGSFRVEVVDQNGCSTTSSPDVTLTKPSSPITVDTTVSNFNGFQIECFGDNNGAITINSISGGTPFGAPLFYSVSWTGPNAFTSTSNNLTNLVPGTYTLNVEDANSCLHTEEFIIETPEEVLITTDTTSNVICFAESDGEILITPTGGTGNYTFSWTKDGALFATTEDLTNIGPGNYEVTLTDSNGCFTTAAYTLTEPTALNLTVDTVVNVLCYGDSTGVIAISVSGGTGAYTYAWTKDGITYSSIEDLSDLGAGLYEITATDAAGCTIIEPITVTQTDEIKVNYTKVDITCSGDNKGAIDLNLSGGLAPYTHTWSDLGTGLTRTNLAAGTYTITVTDALLCTVSETIEINTESTLNVNTTVTNISCFGANDGSIELNITGEQAPLTVTWQDDASAGIDRNNLTPGIYSATIVDGSGCSVNQNFTINEPASIVLDTIITNATDCDNINSGAIDLQVTGGTAPFAFEWSHGATSEDLLSLGANNYTVTVTDSRGCQQQATYTVTRQAPIKLEVLTTANPNCNNKTVIQRNELVITGGVAPYNINWSSGVVSGVNGEIMETNQNGTIIVEVTDNVGCVKELIFNIDVLEIGVPDFDYTSLSFTSFGTLSINDPITFKNTSTGDAVSYQWDFGNGSSSTDQNPAHNFKVTGTYLVTLTVTYPGDCSYSNQQLLRLGLGYSLVVPTAFTPNGDGINDTLRPIFTGMNAVHMSVYDTWGAIVYKESGITINGWDGTINGASAENGNYSIIVQATTFNGVIINTNKPIVLIN